MSLVNAIAAYNAIRTRARYVPRCPRYSILTTANGSESPRRACRLLSSLSLRSMRMSTTTTAVSPAHVQSSRCKCLVSSLISRRSYAVSVVGDLNLPMQITNNEGCYYTTCAADLVENCMLLSYCSTCPATVAHHASYVYAGPNQLNGPRHGQGQLVGYNSACNAGLSGDHSTSPRFSCVVAPHNLY